MKKLIPVALVLLATGSCVASFAVGRQGGEDSQRQIFDFNYSMKMAQVKGTMTKATADGSALPEPGVLLDSVAGDQIATSRLESQLLLDSVIPDSGETAGGAAIKSSTRAQILLVAQNARIIALLTKLVDQKKESSR